jgi:hypothetical protein
VVDVDLELRWEICVVKQLVGWFRVENLQGFERTKNEVDKKEHEQKNDCKKEKVENRAVNTT